MFQEEFILRETGRRVRIVDDFTLTWKNLSVFVKVDRRNQLSNYPIGRTNYPYKRLVHDVTGMIKPGNLVVLLGPSGAGKSTLMEALAFRSSKGVHVEGDVRLNGEPIGEGIRSISGYVHQDDLFVETLTVREHLEFTARLRWGRGKDDRTVGKMVDEILLETGLGGCGDAKIGNVARGKRISGGERKRLALASEVLADPMVLFCDEPTTGLDSFSAGSVVKLLKEMSTKGKTILCTIHQPSSELFAIFDQLILLADGRIAFAGQKENALNFFRTCGYPCPENFNPAEFFMKILSVKSPTANGIKVKKLCDEFLSSEKFVEIEEEIGKIAEVGSAGKEVVKRVQAERARSAEVRKIYWLTARSFLQVLRDPSVQRIRIIQKLAISLTASLCFLGILNLTQSGIQSVQGAIFVLITENTFPPLYGVISIFVDEFPLFLRERKSHLYSTHSYYIAKTISLLPGLIVEPILFVLVAYFTMGLKKTFGAFIMTNIIVILTANVAAACGVGILCGMVIPVVTFKWSVSVCKLKVTIPMRMPTAGRFGNLRGCLFSNAFESVSIVMAFLIPIDYTLMVTSGIFVKLTSLPFAIAWIRYVSWFAYSNEALSIIQWENVTEIACEYANPEIPCLKNGGDVLEKFDFSITNFNRDIAAMAAMYFVLHFSAYLLLCWKSHRNG